MESVFTRARKLLSHSKTVKAEPCGWKIGAMERKEILLESFCRIDDVTTLYGLPIEWTDASSQLDIVLR